MAEKKRIQVTLISTTGKYKPVSTIVNVESAQDYKLNKTKYINAAIVKICQKRLWTKKDLTTFGYTTVKVREYDEEKIKAENAKRYEELKAQKFASGEWKPSKKQLEEMEGKA